ncbi:MAG TPA: hypothetical protein VN181_12260 [Thermoanaerobaculia bacterium]|nr:hypothetical protein [Thermoanaerobaculia bacterium]
MKRLLALTFFLAMAGSAFAQTEPAFDPAATSLPPKFRGNDFDRLFRQYSAPDAPAGRYALVIEPIIEPKYDDATETFDVTLPTQSATIDGKKHVRNPAFRLTQTDLKNGSYEATNAFGVKATVTTREVNEQLLLSRLQGENVLSVPLAVIVPREKAAALKDNLRFALIVALDAKSRVSAEPATRVGRPTLSAPYELTAHEYTLAGDVLGIWAFDGETGRILGKFDPSGKLVAETTKPARREYSPMLQYEYETKVKSGMSQDDIKAIFGDEPFAIVRSEYAGEPVEIWAFEGLRLGVIFSTRTKRVITTRAH